MIEGVLISGDDVDCRICFRFRDGDDRAADLNIMNISIQNISYTISVQVDQ